jgi:hypothetical protein
MSGSRGIDGDALDARMQRAIHELQDVIKSQFPTTTFELVRGPDDPDSLHLLAIADVDDPDEVGDLVVERVAALQVEEGISLHVIPLRTPERIEEALASRSRGVGQRAVRLWGGA